MLEWLRRIFWQSNERRRFFETIGALNVEDGGGEPVVSQELLGSLKLRSATLVLGDPQYLPSVEVSAIAADEIAISATLLLHELKKSRQEAGLTLAVVSKRTGID